MLEIVNSFIQSSETWGDQRPDNWYDQSLSLALTKHHLQHQSKKRHSVREARDGNSIDRHLNNLDAMVEIAKSIQVRKAGGEMSRATTKRKVRDLESLDEDVED
jgi:hypothetical protein